MQNITLYLLASHIWLNLHKDVALVREFSSIPYEVVQDLRKLALVGGDDWRVGRKALLQHHILLDKVR